MSALATSLRRSLDIPARRDEFPSRNVDKIMESAIEWKKTEAYKMRSSKPAEFSHLTIYPVAYPDDEVEKRLMWATASAG